jgi:hypothetical protein
LVSAVVEKARGVGNIQPGDLRRVAARVSLPLAMRTLHVAVVVLISMVASAASKPHIVAFGIPQPARVTFQPEAGESFTVNVSGHVTDVTPESSAEEQ